MRRSGVQNSAFVEPLKHVRLAEVVDADVEGEGDQRVELVGLSGVKISSSTAWATLSRS